MVVYLCVHHHQLVHRDGELSLELKQWCQGEFNRLYPDLDFRSLFGRNYT